MSTNKPELNILLPYQVNENGNDIAFSLLEFTWNAEEKDFEGDASRGGRIEVWDWQKGKKIKSLSYSHAPSIDDMAFSPNGQSIFCLFHNTDPHNPQTKYETSGIFDVVNAHTGAIIWHVEGSEKRPAGFPFAYVSPTQFIVQDALYDIHTKKVKPLFGADDYRLKFVGAVPSHLGRVLLMTKKGLELWDWSAQRLLHRWPSIQDVKEAVFSPDLRVMALTTSVTQRGIKTEFWRFDPRWLK